MFVVDKEPDRLRLAESIGATGLDVSAGDPTEQIRRDRPDGRDVLHEVPPEAKVRLEPHS